MDKLPKGYDVDVKKIADKLEMLQFSLNYIQLKAKQVYEEIENLLYDIEEGRVKEDEEHEE